MPSGRMRKEPTQLRLLTLAGGKGAAPEEAGGIGRACVREVPRPAVAHVVVAVDLRRAPALHFPRTRITWHAMSDINCATTRSMQHSRATRGITNNRTEMQTCYLQWLSLQQFACCNDATRSTVT